MGDVVLTMVQLTFVATVQMVALEQIFDTKLYQNYLGWGEDGKGSHFFSRFELRPWISSAVGIFLAFAFQLQALKFGLGKGGDDMVLVSELIGESANQVDMVLTGLIIGGGTKAIKKVVKQFGEARKEIKDTLA